MKGAKAPLIILRPVWKQRRTPRDLESGDRFGEFELDALLGEGGMGVVFRARRADGSVIALKVMRRELGEEVFKQRFAQEARAAAEVHHPNLVPILDAGEADGRQYLAVRYAEGGTLEDRLREDGALDLGDTLRLADELASGLDALHEAGLVHRDIKASNVVFDASGVSMLTDFGLAKGEGYTVLTRPGQVVGTLDYLAPELVKGQRATPASDIYALGCLLYECTTGKTPFGDKTLFRIGLAHLEEPPIDPSLTRREVDPELGHAVLAALEKDPAARPSSAGLYASLLRQAADSNAA
ncbi:MAG: serine/threonine-protein kinase [Actinomycetota bacterium]